VNDTKPTPKIVDIKLLADIAKRLDERSREINQISLQELSRDLFIAARVCRLLVEIRERLAEIAANALTHPNWDRAAFARDIRELIEPDEAGAGAMEGT